MSVASAARLLLALSTVLATSACAEDDGREQRDEAVSYQPGRNATRGGDPMPPLPCLPPDDPRILGLTSDCAARERRVVAGPVESADGAGGPVCGYVLTYTTPRDARCIVGRPFVDDEGNAKTATLVRNAGWSSFV